MQIHLRLDRHNPPAGTIRRLPDDGRTGSVGADPEVDFVGWLGLLRALSTLIVTPGQDESEERPRAR